MNLEGDCWEYIKSKFPEIGQMEQDYNNACISLSKQKSKFKSKLDRANLEMIEVMRKMQD